MIQSTSSFKKHKKKFCYDDVDDIDLIDTKPNIVVEYESTKSSEREGPADMGATSTLETETEKDKDAQSIFERAQKIQKELEENESENNVYKGVNNYVQYIQVKDSVKGNASSGHVRKGPMRAPENIRSTVRWDYQPDICKDYKETGFCGFGDSCKFLHDRSDYKAGWQLELEGTSKHQHDGDEDDNKYKINDDDDDLPFACFICRNGFKNPIVTRCKHYFCQSCALDHYRKSTRCFVCNAQTNGLFNVAKEIEKRIQNSKMNEQNENENDSE